MKLQVDSMNLECLGSNVSVLYRKHLHEIMQLHQLCIISCYESCFGYASRVVTVPQDAYDISGACSLKKVCRFLVPFSVQSGDTSGVATLCRAYQGTGPGKTYLCPGKTPQLLGINVIFFYHYSTKIAQN